MIDKSKNTNEKWFEIWANDTHSPYPYLLLVVFENNEFKIIDPKENNEVVLTTQDYEEVQNYLWEDEYSIVKGRTSFPSEWWEQI